MRTILSLVFLIILVYCGWTGFKKGLIMGIFSLVAFVISVYGANLLAETYSGEVVDALRPFASGYVETEVVDKKVRPAMGMDAGNLSRSDFFAQNPGREKESPKKSGGIYAEYTKRRGCEKTAPQKRGHL